MLVGSTRIAAALALVAVLNAFSISSRLRTSSDWGRTPKNRATTSISLNSAIFAGSFGSYSTPTMEAFGIASLSNSNRFPLKSSETELSPVTFPPGRARLVTSPSLTGSETSTKTMGIVPVACLAGRVAVPPTVTMTSTLSPTSLAARSGRRLSCHPKTGAR